MSAVRLLIVDKNYKVRQALMGRFDSSKRIEVVGAAATAEQGVHDGAKIDPDVVLLDAKTAGRPDQLGLVVGGFRELGAQVVILTSYASEAEREAAEQAGAAQYLLKDIGSDLLIRKIADIGKPLKASG